MCHSAAPRAASPWTRNNSRRTRTADPQICPAHRPGDRPPARHPIAATVVQRFPLFADFTLEEAEAVAALLEATPLTCSDTLFRQGDPSDSLFLLIDGEVEITVHIPDRADHRLVTLGPGSIIGEMGPLIDEPRAATVRALCDSQLACLSQQALETALDQNERWAGKFLFATAKVLARRLSLLNSELVTTLSHIENERARGGKKTEAELASLRQRLLKDWTF